MVIDLRRAAVFVSVGGAIGSIGFIFQNQKVLEPFGAGFSGLNVYWEMTMMFLSKCKLCISGLCDVVKVLSEL